MCSPDTGHHSVCPSRSQVGKLRLGGAIRTNRQASVPRRGWPVLCCPLLASPGMDRPTRLRPGLRLSSRLALAGTKPPLRNSLDPRLPVQRSDSPSRIGRKMSHSQREQPQSPRAPAYPACREQFSLWVPSLPRWAQGAAAPAEPSQASPATWSPSGSFTRNAGNSNRGRAAHLQPLSPAPPSRKGCRSGLHPVGQES